MRVAGLVLILSAAAVTSLITACGKTSCPDPPATRGEDASKPDEDLVRMTEQARRHPELCRELLEPSLTLTGDDLILTGAKRRTIARRAELAAGEVQSIERLEASLRAYRKQWQTLHPGSYPDGELSLTLDPALETPRALSVLLTATHAGYRNVRLTAGATSFQATWWGSIERHYFIERILVIDKGVDGTSSVLLRGARCSGSALAKAKDAEIPALIARVCAETPPETGGHLYERTHVARCFDAVDIRAPASGNFGALADFVRSVVATFPSLRAPGQHEIELALRLLITPDVRDPMDDRTPSEELQYGPSSNYGQFCTLPDGGYDSDAMVREMTKRVKRRRGEPD